MSTKAWRVQLLSCLGVFFGMLVMAAVAGTSELEQARNRQDLPALERIISQCQQAAQAKSQSAEATYQLALAYSYAAEVAIEIRDKKKAEALAEKGIEAAKKAVSEKPSNAEY